MYCPFKCHPAAVTPYHQILTLVGLSLIWTTVMSVKQTKLKFEGHYSPNEGHYSPNENKNNQVQLIHCMLQNQYMDETLNEYTSPKDGTVQSRQNNVNMV